MIEIRMTSFLICLWFPLSPFFFYLSCLRPFSRFIFSDSSIPLLSLIGFQLSSSTSSLFICERPKHFRLIVDSYCRNR